MHIIRAADLANGLCRRVHRGIGKVERIVGTEAKDFYGKLCGRTGIIFIHAYWLRQGETTPSGDHITTSGTATAPPQVADGVVLLASAYYSKYVKAKEVWFWDVK